MARTIEGTFDFMVNHDLEILQGRLYQFPPSTTSPLSTVQPETVVAGPPLKQTKNRSQRDPYLPKSTRTGYHFFFIDKYSELKNLCPERVKEFRTLIAESWRKLSLREKKVYYNKALKDKERYKREMEIYEEMKPVPKRRKLNSEVKKEDE